MTTKQDLAEDTTLEAEPQADEAEARGDEQTGARTDAQTEAEAGPTGEQRAEAEAEERPEEEQPKEERPKEGRAKKERARVTAQERAEVEAEERAEEPGEERREGAGRTGTSKGARWRGVALGAVLALVLAATGGTAVLQWMTADRLQGQLTPLEHDRLLRLEVSGAASAFATTLLSYDYKDLQTTRGQVIAMTAGNFLATYDEAFGGPMEQVIIKLEAVSKATVREVYLSEVDEVSAKALISVDQQVTSKEAVRNVLGTHLKLTMIKQKGVWKVSDVTVLGAAKETETKLGKGD
ncbi:hypothetical protein GCM10010404_64450 [Nonomuraea africana]|uniref:Mce-associated membrane protein n=1 Tax=Nonomuraea africana TaxID=46171 RepID=A0ABR9KGV8_9ACTN|nr:hypothetical protein [Nonomuraea africana]MBE1561264.1 hypothetical protein [Nonomuraea africana]